MKLKRRAFLQFLGLSPLAPAAADLTSEAKAVPAKPSGEIILRAGGKIDVRFMGGMSDCSPYTIHSFEDFVHWADNAKQPAQEPTPEAK